jgi:hypothetical protein
VTVFVRSGVTAHELSVALDVPADELCAFLDSLRRASTNPLTPVSDDEVLIVAEEFDRPDVAIRTEH